MDIKRYGSQRMVFKESIVSRIKWALALILLVPITYIFPFPVNIILGVILVAYISAQVVIDNSTIIIDKTNQKIMAEYRNDLFIRKKHVIPFSNYMKVILHRDRTSDGFYRVTSVTLSVQVGGDRILLDNSENEEAIRAEAHLVSSFTGWELSDTLESYTTMSTTEYNPNQPREEIVAKWKQRMEQERKEEGKKE